MGQRDGVQIECSGLGFPSALAERADTPQPAAVPEAVRSISETHWPVPQADPLTGQPCRPLSSVADGPGPGLTPGPVGEITMLG